MPRLPPVTANNRLLNNCNFESILGISPMATGFGGISFFFLAIIARSREITLPAGAKAEARGSASMSSDQRSMSLCSFEE